MGVLNDFVKDIFDALAYLFVTIVRNIPRTIWIIIFFFYYFLNKNLFINILLTYYWYSG